jgi:predicted enzyme related to lactoylglutathione lyase
MPEPTRFQSIMPEMPVRNLTAAVGFYTDVLGFKLEHLHGDEYAVMRREACRLGVFRASSQAAEPGLGRFYAFVTGVDDYFAYVERALVTGGSGRVIESLAPRPYGLKDFAILDPDGNRLAFAEYLKE